MLPSAPRLAARGAHRTPVKARFPTKFNPIRSAYKQKIITPEGVAYNPSPAPPTPFETPAAFLPSQDKRSYVKDSKDYPVHQMPALSPRPTRTYHLSQDDAAEIQRLRWEDPNQWTRKALAEKFGVSQAVIGMVSSSHPARASEMHARLETIKGMWNDKRARARAHRQQRKFYWLRDA